MPGQLHGWWDEVVDAGMFVTDDKKGVFCFQRGTMFKCISCLVSTFK